jgi:hypothetical protein
MHPQSTATATDLSSWATTKHQVHRNWPIAASLLLPLPPVKTQSRARHGRGPRGRCRGSLLTHGCTPAAHLRPSADAKRTPRDAGRRRLTRWHRGSARLGSAPVPLANRCYISCALSPLARSTSPPRSASLPHPHLFDETPPRRGARAERDGVQGPLLLVVAQVLGILQP